MGRPLNVPVLVHRDGLVPCIAVMRNLEDTWRLGLGKIAGDTYLLSDSDFDGFLIELVHPPSTFPSTSWPTKKPAWKFESTFVPGQSGYKDTQKPEGVRYLDA